MYGMTRSMWGTYLLVQWTTGFLYAILLFPTHPALACAGWLAAGALVGWRLLVFTRKQDAEWREHLRLPSWRMVGPMWIDGSAFCVLDARGERHTYEGIPVATRPDAVAGSVWVDPQDGDDHLHYIDRESVERRLVGVKAIAAATGALERWPGLAAAGGAP